MNIVKSNMDNIQNFVKTLNPNVTISFGINWVWVKGFKSKEEAQKFVDYCENNNGETRGVEGNDVRFRC